MSNLNLLGKLRTKVSIADKKTKQYMPSLVTLGVLAALNPVFSPAVNASNIANFEGLKATEGEVTTKANKQDEQLQRSTQIPDNNDGTTYKLGNGYNSEENEFISNTTVYVTNPDGSLNFTNKGNTEGFLSFSVDLSRNEVLQQISGELNADLNYASVNLSGNVSIASDYAADDYIGTYTLFARVKPKKSVYDVSEDGKSNGLQPSPAITAFYNHGNNAANIGDEFVHAVEYGSWVLVTLKFEYRDAKEKLDIGGQFDVNWQGTVSVNGGGSYASIENSQTVDVTLEAIQYGGDSSALSNIMSSNTTSCTLNNPQACFNTFSDAVTYLRDDYPDQFYSGGQLDLSKFKITRYLTRKYKDSGPDLRAYVESPLPPLSLTSNIALREAYNRWESADMDIRRADVLIGKISGTTALKTKLQALRTTAIANRNSLKSLIETCPDQGGSYCATQWQNQTFFKSYDRAILDSQ